MRSRINYVLLVYMNVTRLEKFEVINNKIMRTVLNLNNETNLDISLNGQHNETRFSNKTYNIIQKVQNF